MKKYLIINLGSASKKYSLYEDEREVFRAHFEMEDSDFVVTESVGAAHEKTKISQEEYNNSGKRLLDVLVSKNIIKDAGEIAALGFRVVAPGEYFVKVQRIDAKYRDKLKEAYEMAPLHISAVLKGIEEFMNLLPNTSMIGVSDSAFHSTIPEMARLYALPIEDGRKYGIYRYGYHGISVASVLNTAKEMLGSPPHLSDANNQSDIDMEKCKISNLPFQSPESKCGGNLPPRVIVCHLGSGSSITAVKDGKSIDTSMGFTPLEGVVMATRTGDIDPGALLYLGKKLNLSFDEMDEYLNHKCGLLGLSGKESGVRELIELEKQGDENAKTALAVWAYRVKKYIGAYTAALGGLDLLIFTATIGERSFIMRERICDGLGNLGIAIDKEKNNQLNGGKSGFIENGALPVKVAVITTDEMKQIAREIMGRI